MSSQYIKDIKDLMTVGTIGENKKWLSPLWIFLATWLISVLSIPQAIAAEEIVLYPVPEKHYQSSIYVTGLTTQTGEVLQAKVNDSVVAETISNASGDFAVRIPLQSGDNQLRVTSDSAQSDIYETRYVPTGSGSEIWKVNASGAEPESPLLDPLPDTTSGNPITVTGTAPPGTSVSFFVNGRYTRTIEIDASGVFSTWAPLEDGNNSIYTIAENEDGQSPVSNTINTEYSNSTQRDWSGELTETMVWTVGDGTPYSLSGNFTIPAGTTLWLQPGVQLDISGNYKLHTQGNLVVAGNEALPAIFKPTTSACNGIDDQRQDWPGIE
uniref:hypothetical protein n=1 Tax=Microbulbifer litoralis TaxID=2933965 RepID=UPI00202907F5